jgi:hypothetical protein
MESDSDAVQGEQDIPAMSPFVLTAEDEARIREAARDVLRRSLATLAEERVVPRSRYRPWIRMARDYFGHAVERSEGPLAKALEAALPARFDRQRGPAPDHPWSYGSALLEAAVAAATMADEPCDVASPSVQATIDEFIAKLRAVPRSTVLRVVADVDVEHRPVAAAGYHDRLGETIEVAGARVIRVEYEPEPFIEREIPSAGQEVERSQVFVFPGPASLLASTVELMADHATRASEARRRVSHLVEAIRLATGSTARAVVDIAGEPDRIRWISPSITPLPSWDFQLVHRPVTLSEATKQGLEYLVSFIGSMDEGSWTPVSMALSRLGRSLDRWTPGIMDQVVDLAIGLEAALGDADKTEIGLRLRTRAANILATGADPPDAIYRDVKTLYELRSAIVHGGNLSEKIVKKAITSVTGTTASRWPGEQYLLALDRWRDLLRRAVLARIALTTSAAPWTAQAGHGRRLDVDQFILRDKNRDAWTEHIRAFWADHGLPDAPNPPPAARMTIGVPPSAAQNAVTNA